MDGSIFDRFTQAVGGGSRRIALKTALGGATLGAAGLLASAGTGSNAKKKKCKKKKCPKCEALDAGAPCTSNLDCCANETDLSCALISGGMDGQTVCCGGLGATCEEATDCCVGFFCPEGACVPVLV